VLQREAVPRRDVEQLADVLVGVRPPDLVAPGLLDSLDLHGTPLFARIRACVEGYHPGPPARQTHGHGRRAAMRSTAPRRKRAPLRRGEPGVDQSNGVPTSIFSVVMPVGVRFPMRSTCV